VDKPSISIVIPTYNSSRSLADCLSSIYAQQYPREKLEIIIIDAGSSDATQKIASSKGVDKILENPLKTGEAGKAVGIDAASGEIIALIDSDNILEGEDWLENMVAPFEDPDVFCSECYALTYRSSDSLVDRYCALLGMNDPVHLFLGNYDRLSRLTGKWTGLPLAIQDKQSYYEVLLTPDCIPTMGANGCLIRKDILKEVDYRPYYFDIDVIYQLVQKGCRKAGFVKKGIIHLYCPDLKTFARKQKRRISDFLHYRRLGRRSYPHQQYFWGYVKFVVSTVLVFPLLIQALRGYMRKNDRAWFVHPFACWITLSTYAWATIRSLFQTGELDRTNWKQ
jgi:glycosyltransferase involved in cell wall biosynthesis